MLTYQVERHDAHDLSGYNQGSVVTGYAAFLEADLATTLASMGPDMARTDSLDIVSAHGVDQESQVGTVDGERSRSPIHDMIAAASALRTETYATVLDERLRPLDSATVQELISETNSSIGA